MIKDPIRVLWLLNHTTLRQFECAQLQKLGVTEIFTPKRFPFDEANLSASVTHEFDASISLSPNEMSVLNSQDWYGQPSESAWEVVNKHFSVAFIGFFPEQMLSTCRFFRGAIIVRCFGLGGNETYSRLIPKVGGVNLESAIKQAGRRLLFGMGYEHLKSFEEPFVADRSVLLPVGLRDTHSRDRWKGDNRQILFVCPRIETSPYYRQAYQTFIDNLGDFPHVIGGHQPIATRKPNVLGFLSSDEYDELMINTRLMFYHSRERNHVHYHPFEAIRMGMPLVFMADGLLDRIGGERMPGRCTTYREARATIKRILQDDRRFINKLRRTQLSLLTPLSPEACEPIWRREFSRIILELREREDAASVRPLMPDRPRRVAVILPVEYRGGSLRGAILLAKAIQHGSRESGEPVEVVFLHVDTPEYAEGHFSDLPPTIRLRPFTWDVLRAGEAQRAMHYAGFNNWEPSHLHYMVANDQIRQLQDCDLWIVVSDRLALPLLPLRPVVLMVYDYLQRYVDLLSPGADLPYINAARSADHVLVTTDFTRKDALQYAGLAPKRVSKVPLLAPDFPILRPAEVQREYNYFVWTTNAAPHKNHQIAAEALRHYYEELDGSLSCKVTGVDTKSLLSGPNRSHLRGIASLFKESKRLREHVVWQGELSEGRFQNLLQNSAFLLHAARVDNGTFSVIEAACLGVPSVSTDYPAMREIDAQFSLGLKWARADSAKDLAEGLKFMERNHRERRRALPSPDALRAQRFDQLAAVYWRELRKCL